MNTIVEPVVVFLATPLLAAVLSFATTHARVLHGVNLATMTCLVVSEVALIQQVLAHGPQIALWGLVYIDALSAFILFIVTFIGLSCSLYTWTYLDDYLARSVITPRRLSWFFVLFHAFLFAMIVATMRWSQADTVSQTAPAAPITATLPIASLREHSQTLRTLASPSL